MANKAISIKGASDKELDDVLIRLRKELEVQNLIASLKRRATEGFIPYDNPQVSTEEPVDTLYHLDKSKSIKQMTDAELDEMLTRLRKENQVQDLIIALKCNSSKEPIRYENAQVSTEEAIESLYHFGILGMKWHRKKASGGTKEPSKDGQTKETKPINSEDHNKKVALKTKKLNEMTNDEIRTYTQRMALEKQYKEFSKAEMSRGKKFVNDMINSVTKGARDAAMNYASKQAAKMVEDLLKKTSKAAT